MATLGRYAIGLLSCLAAFGSSPAAALRPDPVSGPRWFGVAQNTELGAFDYVPYLQDQKTFANTAVLAFAFARGQVIAPTPEALTEAADFDFVTVNLGKRLWREGLATRSQLMDQLRKTAGFDAVQSLVVVDEPYLEGYTPQVVRQMIAEVDGEFPALETIVNFNPRGLKLNPTFAIPPQMDYVSVDVYPCTLGLSVSQRLSSTLDEAIWKDLLEQTIDFVRSKSRLPLLLVAQGFSTPTCPLAPRHIDWSFEVALERQLEGIVYWFPENRIQAGKIGFTDVTTTEAADRLRDLGRERNYR